MNSCKPLRTVRTPPGFLPPIKSDQAPIRPQPLAQECRLQTRALAFNDQWKEPLLFHTYQRGKEAALVYKAFLLYFHPGNVFQLWNRCPGADRKYLDRIKSLAQAVIDADLAPEKGTKSE